MRPERWPRFKELLGAALELGQGNRAAWLRGLADDDRDLADELERWLALEPHPRFLDAPASPAASWERAPRLALGPNARVGRYRVIALLGLGSSGVVFEAEQDAPRRRVALKVLLRGLFSDAARRRFLDEASALALLDHPGVARVLEAGTFAQDGIETPYIAMELVAGATDVVTHAAAHGLAREERVALFLELCTAVGQGHARGVIHRDLKPANVLVDRAGRVKVIDFGIARIVAGRSGPRPTERGDVLGTAPYMSPEQARGELDALDTRTDVYSLGVILHELLSGELPPAPARLWKRGTRDARIPADLAAVIACALDPEPARRYASALELAADVNRFLDHRPVEARPPRFGHHARLLVRRHRRAVALWSAMIGALAAAVLGITIHAARREAREREKAENVTRFLLSLIERVRPSVGGHGDVLFRDVLAEAARRIDSELGDAREERAELHATLGVALRELGAYDEGVRELEKALALSRATARDGHPAPCRLNALGDVLVSAGRAREAEGVLREALALEEARGDVDPITSAITSNHLARALLQQGELAEAAERAAHARTVYARELGERHESVAAAERTLGDIARARADRVRAERHYRAALAVDSIAHGADSLQAAQDRLRLGEVLLDAGQAGARDELERARQRLSELLPEDHPDRLRAAELLAESSG